MQVQHKINSNSNSSTELPFELAGDASAYSLRPACALSCFPDGEKHVVFISQNLAITQKLYTSQERDSLTDFVINKFHQSLFGCHLTLVMDHKTLTTLLSLVTTFGPSQNLIWQNKNMLPALVPGPKGVVHSGPTHSFYGP